MNSTESTQAGPIAVRKRRWYEGIYARFSAAFLFILIIVAAINVFLSLQIWKISSVDIEQRTHWNLAEQIASQLQPELAERAPGQWLVEELFRFQELFPSIGFYLLDARGQIIEHSVDARQINIWQIPLGNILEASKPILPELPLYNIDPITESPSVFSVTRTVCDGKPCFLYLSLTSGIFESLQNTRGQYQLLRYTGWLVLLGAGLMVFLGLGLFAFLSQGFSDVLMMVRKIEVGDFTSRIPIRKNDEIGEISRAINTMADAVEDSVAALEATDQQRRELVANISHDLRGPLTVIEGFLETVIKRGAELSEEERSGHLQRIYRNVLQQKQLTADLFELSKLEAKDKTPNLEAFSILELVYDAAAKYRSQAEEKQMSIEVNTTQDPGPVLADISMIDRVLSNLISNAIRYCPEGTLITLSVEPQDHDIRVGVSDNGHGIAAEDLERIFESFYRVDKDRSRVSGGSGLGLAIVKKMIESHGSTISVKSKPGEGTSFRFELKRA